MLKWKKELELGIKSIDDQHKKLLEIGNKINGLLMKQGEESDHFDEIYTVIEELKAYTVYHFRTEEALLKKHGYADYATHKKEHDDFIKYIESVNYKTVADNQMAFLKELLGKIVQWVFKHILSTDYLYQAHLLKAGVK